MGLEGMRVLVFENTEDPEDLLGRIGTVRSVDHGNAEAVVETVDPDGETVELTLPTDADEPIGRDLNPFFEDVEDAYYRVVDHTKYYRLDGPDDFEDERSEDDVDPTIDSQLIKLGGRGDKPAENWGVSDDAVLTKNEVDRLVSVLNQFAGTMVQVTGGGGRAIHHGTLKSATAYEWDTEEATGFKPRAHIDVTHCNDGHMMISDNADCRFMREDESRGLVLDSWQIWTTQSTVQSVLGEDLNYYDGSIEDGLVADGITDAMLESVTDDATTGLSM